MGASARRDTLLRRALRRHHLRLPPCHAPAPRSRVYYTLQHPARFFLVGAPERKSY